MRWNLGEVGDGLELGPAVWAKYEAGKAGKAVKSYLVASELSSS